MVATVTLTATPNTATSPPKIRLVGTATGTPTVSSLTIYRTDPDGSSKLVRTPDGGPLVLAGGTATIDDFEAPFGAPVQYSVPEGTAPTTSATLSVSTPWLIHLGTPSMSVPLDFMKDSFSEEAWDLDQGVFPILGRPEPMVITGGSRQAPSSEMIVGTDTLTDLDNLQAILADGSTLLLNVSPALNLGIKTEYVAIGAARAKRRSDVGTDARRNITLPYQTVARPTGGTRTAVMWSDVGATYATWAGIPVGKTWAQVVL